MIAEDDLTRLLSEAAGAFPEPDLPALEVPSATPVWRRRGVRLVAAAAALVAAGLLVSTAGLPGQDARTEVTAETSKTYRGDGGAAGGGSNSGSTLTPSLPYDVGAPPAPAAAVAQPQRAAASDTATVTQPQSAPVAVAPDTRDDARVVKTGRIGLVVDDGKVSATVSRVTQVATARRGYVSDSATQEYGDSPSATVTLRVPVGSFESVVQGIRDLGAEVASSEVSGKDVTADYADTEAQIASLKAARERFLAILAGAKTIGETLTVQQRVDSVQGQIDRLEGQRRVLASQSDYGTLTVTVGEKDDEQLVRSEPSGFGKAWDDAKDGFTGGVQGLIARSGRALLVGLVAVVALLVLRLGWRLARRRLV